ncbi:hypothetical protein TYRP_015282 [Tyrophagus putrescentiae]|nr:hypothetical protein TYRP_015282 [Tyrophagus putrescentiae]
MSTVSTRLPQQRITQKIHLLTSSSNFFFLALAILLALAHVAVEEELHHAAQIRRLNVGVGADQPLVGGVLQRVEDPPELGAVVQLGAVQHQVLHRHQPGGELVGGGGQAAVLWQRLLSAHLVLEVEAAADEGGGQLLSNEVKTHIRETYQQPIKAYLDGHGHRLLLLSLHPGLPLLQQLSEGCWRAAPA